MRELVERKRKANGEKVIEDPDTGKRSGSNVVDLMAALKKSMEKGGAGAANDDKPAPVKKPARMPVAKKLAAAEEPAPAPARKPRARKRA